MILQVMRRTELDRVTVTTSVFATVNTFMLAVLLRGPITLDDISIAAMAPALLLVAFPLLRLRTRATPFELRLPVHGRTLFQARLLWTLVLVLAPWFAWILAAPIGGHEGPSVPLALEVLAIATLAVVLPHRIRPRETTGPALWQTSLLWAGIAAVSWTVISLLPSAVAAGALCLLALAAFLVTQRAIPESFVLPSTVEEAPSSTSSVVAASGGRFTLLPVVARELVAMPLLLFFGLSLFSGLLGPSLMLLLVMLLSTVTQARVRTQWMDALPFSPRARLLAALVPGVLLPVALFATGRQVGLPRFELLDAMGGRAPSTSPPGGFYDSPTRVPLEFWRPARARASSIEITAPWGERTLAYTLRVPGATYFNPYSSREENSQRFIDWQFANATAAVYGRSIPRAQYESEGYEYPPRLTESPRMKVLKVGALVCYGLVVAFLIELGFWHRLAQSRPIHLAAQFLASVPLYVMLGVDMRYGLDNGTDIVVPLVVRALLKLSRTLPDSLPVVLAVTAVPVVGLYLLVQWQSRYSEIPRHRRIKPVGNP